MASFNEKSQVSIAANAVHKFPLHCMALTTGNFMQFDVAFAKELPKSGSNKFNHQSFVRCMPMQRPLMSSVQFHKSAYFVPFRTVWPAYTDFLEDTPHVQQEGAAILSNVPLIKNSDLVEFFLKYGLTALTWEQASSRNAYDVAILDVDSESATYGLMMPYKFNAFGRHCLKLLRGIGYMPYWTEYGSVDSDPTFSALPLLCAAKIYIDFFYPQQYAKTGAYINLDGIFNRHYIYNMSVQDLWSVFTVCYTVSYNSDYFVSAFDSAIGATDGVVSDNFQIKDISVDNIEYSDMGSLTVKQDQLTPYVEQGAANYKTTLTQYMDDVLKSLTNYIRRHALSGSRALERYLADWGVALSADKLQRCYKLGEKHYPLQVSDVTSTADTITDDGGAALGDFAGRGIAYNNDFNFEVDTDEFGYVMVINTIVPDVSYGQGIDYNVLHKTKLDFLTGEFDGLVNRPILQSELFVGFKRRSDDVDNIFGFCPSYAEYKNVRDTISGDFILDTKNIGLMGWSTARLFSDQLNDDDFNEVHNLNFVLGNDADQYNRVFMSQDDDSDKFIVIHRCNMDLHLPAVPLYDYYDFADNKQKILLEVNGAKSN